MTKQAFQLYIKPTTAPPNTWIDKLVSIVKNQDKEIKHVSDPEDKGFIDITHQVDDIAFYTSPSHIPLTSFSFLPTQIPDVIQEIAKSKDKCCQVILNRYDLQEYWNQTSFYAVLHGDAERLINPVGKVQMRIDKNISIHYVRKAAYISNAPIKISYSA